MLMAPTDLPRGRTPRLSRCPFEDGSTDSETIGGSLEASPPFADTEVVTSRRVAVELKGVAGPLPLYQAFRSSRVPSRGPSARPQSFVFTVEGELRKRRFARR